MKIIPTVVIIPIAEDEGDAATQAEEILEISAIEPYGEGELNENGIWESFAVGWLSEDLPVNKETGDEEDTIQIKNLDVDDFFLKKGTYAEDFGEEYEDDDDEEIEEEEAPFIPEALVMPDGKWMDSYSLSEGIDWKDYFMETMHGLAEDNWLVFIEAAE